MSRYWHIYLILPLFFPLLLLADEIEYEIVKLNSSDGTIQLEYPHFNEDWLNELIEKRSLKWYEDLVAFKARKADESREWQFSDHIDVIYQSERVLVLQSSTEETTSRANQEYYKGYKNFDIKNRRELTLTDLFKPAMIDQMMIYGEKAFREQVQLNEGESLIRQDHYFDRGFRLAKTFALTKEGIRFTYNRNELLPFVDEMVEILIPYSFIIQCEEREKSLLEWIDL